MSVLAAFALALGVVFLVELPDKTLVATLVLATRYRHLPVLIGVASAFAVQCTVAVVAGGLLQLLPHRLVEGSVAVLFLAGAALLLWEARKSEEDEVELAEAREEKSSWQIALTCFGVLFVAEWGDASQLATAALVARTNQTWPVGLGSWVALVSVAGVAIVAGKYVIGRIPLRLVHLIAAGIFSAFAVVALVAVIRG